MKILLRLNLSFWKKVYLKLDFLELRSRYFGKKKTWKLWVQLYILKSLRIRFLLIGEKQSKRWKSPLIVGEFFVSGDRRIVKSSEFESSCAGPHSSTRTVHGKAECFLIAAWHNLAMLKKCYLCLSRYSKVWKSVQETSSKSCLVCN